jgi:hypothetical protein
MITKKEIMIRLCELEAKVESLAGSCKRIQSRLTKLEKPEEMKVTKKAK